MNENKKNNNEEYESLFSTEADAGCDEAEDIAEDVAEEVEVKRGQQSSVRRGNSNNQQSVNDEDDEDDEDYEYDEDEEEVMDEIFGRNRKKESSGNLLPVALIALAAAIIVASIIFVFGGGSKKRLGTSGKETESAGTEQNITIPGTSQNGGGTQTQVQQYKPDPDVNAGNVSFSTENYGFTNAQVAFVFNSYYQDLLSTISYYGYTTDMFGLDISKSLKDQVSSLSSEGETWFEYILNGNVRGNIIQTLTLCEAAKAAGFEASEEDLKSIDDWFDNIEASATKENKTLEEYLKEYMGPDATVEAIREAMTMSLVANAYVNHCVSQGDTSDAALETEYAKNPNIADTVDVIVLNLDYNELLDENADDAAKEQAKNNCRTYASEIAKAADKEAFLAAAKDCLMNSFSVAEADLETLAGSIVYENLAYSEGEIYDWAFGDVAPGETKVFEDEETGYVAVAFFIERNGRNETPSNADVHYILFDKNKYTDDSTAQQVYNDWIASGATVEELEKLVVEYTDDSSAVESKGLYKDVTPGATVPAFNDWIFDASRKVGDHTVVYSTEYGWFIIYVDRLGEVSWKATVKSAIENEIRSSVIKAASDTYTVTVDEEILATLPA